MDNQTQPIIPPVQPTPQNPATPRTKWFRKIVLGLTIIIFIIALFHHNILFDKTFNEKTKPSINPTASPIPTINPSTGWQTYSNTTYKYSFQYKNLILTDNQVDKFVRLQDTIAKKGLSVYSDEYFNLIISVVPNNENQTPQEYVKNIAESKSIKISGWDLNETSKNFYLKRKNAIINSFKDYINGGIGGIIGDIDGYENPNVTVIFTKNNFLYIFSLLGGPNTGTPVTETAKTTLNQILSTFKFTN